MCDGNVLIKVGHFVMHKDVTWQVDVYDDILKGIVIAEIELTARSRLANFRLGRRGGYGRSEVQKSAHARGTAG